MRLDALRRRLGADEQLLSAHLRALADRHADDPEVALLALDLADWSDRHAEALGHGSGGHPTATGQVELSANPDPGLALLDDLTAVHVRASAVALSWQLVGQAAQALHDADLQATVQRCRPESVRQAAWAAAQAKQAGTQILVT
ncbi:hypothetical protein [Cellulomonas sp.]|uniref:hypothetical protein n=1 Tax=Cellulomonas sp. TaxID=40001 RepID=UPI001B22C7E8|nr:hypothetical protein [Cellulomonas sp.]MBO9555164.1 hypothetical protein [Cellulomonas sp.]